MQSSPEARDVPRRAEAARPLRLLILDPHALFGACLASALRPDGRFAAVEIATEPAEVLRRLAMDGADVVDVVIVGGEGPERALELTRDLCRKLPDLKVLVLDGEDSKEHAVACLEAGARGYLLRRSSLADLAAAVERVGRGETLCTPRAAHGLFRRLSELGAERRRRSRLDLLDLTPRELEVLRLMAGGASNAEIAASLVLSVHTVKNHVHSILAKLGVASRWEAVRQAGERGWLEGDRRG